MTINVGDNKTKISLEEALKRFEGDFKTEDIINVVKTREEFVKQYPIDRIANLTFDEYCRDEESFTKKIRWDLRRLASMGNAYPDTFGIYVKKDTSEIAMSKTFDKLCNGNADIAFKTIISEIVKLLSDFDRVGFEAINGIHLNKMFVYKLLLIYYPERTFHVCAKGTLQQYCECIGLQLDTRDEMYVGIQKLLEWKKTEEAFSGWDNTRLMWFCDFLVRSNYCIGGEGNMDSMEEDKNVTVWCISGNPKRYDVINAFHDLGKVDWKQTANFEVGDIVYIYVSATYQQVKFKCRVNKIDLKNVEIDDGEYNLSGEFDGSYGRYMELEPIAVFNTGLFSRERLENYGFVAPQGAIKVNTKLNDYFNVVQFLLNSKEMDPDEHDGSYELFRETVRAYKNYDDIDSINYLDLNLLYHMVIGTWKHSVEQKKKSIRLSHLPDYEKERLYKLLEEVVSKSNEGKYKTHKGRAGYIGMFGTGFYSFESDDGGYVARKFIKLCIDILDLDDDNDIYRRVENCFRNEFKGIKAASASAMLHCLKPYIFPILNTNHGSNTIYEYFELPLQKIRLLSTYASNCRMIKEFRDKYFYVKNYRIFDCAARMLSKDEEKDMMGFVPTLEDYNPNISSEEFKRILSDENKIKKQWTDVLYYLYKMGGQGSCKQIAIQYGNNPMHYSAHATTISKTVQSETNCEVYDGLDFAGYWCILFYGKNADSNEEGSFIWKLREPLEQAIKELDEENFFEFLNGDDGENMTEQKKFKLIIKSDSVISEDEKILEGDYSSGDNYKPVNAYFESAEHEIVYRQLVKNENPISNQTLPRIACQLFEKNIEELSDYEREEFPICRYRPQDKLYKGIYLSEEEFRKHSKSFEMGNYKRENGPQFFFYSWSIFSTIVFVQECLKQFGKQGDQFVLEYEYKQDKNNDEKIEEEVNKRVDEYQNPYSKVILKSKNVIFRGAPGTGKTYLAKQIAADIITNGQINDFAELSDEQKEQVEFVQFHPNYDYSDFVEGLRPVLKDDGTMGFELKDGIFKAFVNRAKKNLENSKKSEEEQKRDLSVDLVMQEFFDEIESEEKIFRNIKGGEFKVTDVDDKHIYVSILKDDVKENINLNIDELRKMVESNRRFERVIDVTKFFKKQFATQGYSYLLTLCNAILDRGSSSSNNEFVQEELKKYIFIIDEINRGEISKILGELFYSIDPGYRGKSGMVDTQYQNMHSDLEEKFYIPENVYIIGTMNDIDRSVDSFDFAMRRRFRFIEVKAKETQHMLISLEEKDEAIKRMDALNKAIAETQELNENYQIGASYFLKLKNGIGFDELWTDYLCPLLQDYVRGLYDEDELMSKFAKAYGYEVDENGDEDEDRG